MSEPMLDTSMEYRSKINRLTVGYLDSPLLTITSEETGYKETGVGSVMPSLRIKLERHTDNG